MSQDESAAKVPDDPPFRTVDGNNVRPIMRRAPLAAPPAYRSRVTPTLPDSPANDGPGHDDDVVRERPDDSLLKDPFLKQLEREKRRVDRSKTHLSMILFRFDGKKEQESQNVRRLFALLHKTRRETDILGRMSDDLIGILLPDTNKQGAKVFMEKIVSRANDMTFSTIVETYPDHLFDNLVSGTGSLTDHADLFHDERSLMGGVEEFLKRTFDILLSVVLIIAASPLMLITAIAIELTSPGPIIFRQTRLGRGGVPFEFYKFRSMYCNTDDQIHREFVSSLIKGEHELVNQQDAADPLFKLKSDPRITSVGRIIRQTSIDELPQLFNVLKGDMSLVGPRPPLPYEAIEYQSWHLRRILEVRPGITGLWQVEGRSKVSFDEMVRMDLRYIKNRSLYYDFRLLLKTVKVVLRQDGAK